MDRIIVTNDGVYQVGVGCCGETGCSLAGEDECVYTEQCSAGKFEGYERVSGEVVKIALSKEEFGALQMILQMIPMFPGAQALLETLRLRAETD